MTGIPIRALVREGAAELERAGIPGPRLDAEVLLADALALERVILIAHADRLVDVTVAAPYRENIARRATGCPLAYVRGWREFYGLDLAVDPRVLIPRPETEHVVEWALEKLGSGMRVADVGTGSGAIAVALAVETRGRDVEIHGVDVSEDALDVARANAVRHDVIERITFHRGDLLEPLEGRFHRIVSNPPYVAAEDPALEPDVARFEPALALRDVFEGDGLGFYRRLAREAANFLLPDGDLILEIGDGQASAVRGLLQAAGFEVEVRRDLAGIERVVRGVVLS